VKEENVAIAQCEECGPPIGRKRIHIYKHYPIGYPNDAIICSLPKCTNPALIWLTSTEQSYHLAGSKIFGIGWSLKVKLVWFQAPAGIRRPV